MYNYEIYYYNHKGFFKTNVSVNKLINSKQRMNALKKHICNENEHVHIYIIDYMIIK